MSGKSAMSSRVRGEALAVALACALTVGLHAALFLRYLPTGSGTLGHDYGYVLPYLLNGDYWFSSNGCFDVPWFTPAFGGGIPLFANPGSFYYSFPQLLSFAVDPLQAVRWTLVVFAALGYAGTYVLLRRGFGARLAPATFGAVAFTFNGFFAHRVLIGHLGFHSTMLVPWIAWWCLSPLSGSRSHRGIRGALATALAALGFSYMFQSGNLHGIAPAVLAVVGVAALASFARPLAWLSSLSRLAAAGAIALALCAAKLNAGRAFLASFPRTGYSLPGWESALEVLGLAVRSVFFAPAHAAANQSAAELTWALDRHEFEYGVTFVPALMLATGALVGGSRVGRSKAWSELLRRHASHAAVLLVVLAIPIAVNLYSPGWNARLKDLPLLGSSSTLVRWFSAYIPLVAAAAAIALDRLALPRAWECGAALAASIAVIAIHASSDRRYYAEQQYRPGRIVAAHARLSSTGEVPPIEAAAVSTDAEGRPVLALDRNDALVQGISQIACIEPMFGYRLEWFPRSALHPGPSLEETAGVLNVNDPACFVFPEANGCRPGAPFRADDRERALAFLAYRPIEFAVPARQRLANALTSTALVVVLAFVAVASVLLVRARALPP